MSAGRHAVGKPAEGALKSARSVLFLTAGILAPLALFGLGVYWLTVGTNLEVYGVISLMWLAAVIGAIVQRRGDRWFVWFAAGALVTTTFQFATALAKHRHWPASSLHSLAVTTDVVDGVVAVVFGVVVLIWVWTVALRWLRRRPGHS